MLAVVVQVPRFKDCFIQFSPSKFLLTKTYVLGVGLVPVAFSAIYSHCFIFLKNVSKIHFVKSSFALGKLIVAIPCSFSKDKN